MTELDFIMWHHHCLHIDGHYQALKCCRCDDSATLNDIHGTSLVYECPSSLIPDLNPDINQKLYPMPQIPTNKRFTNKIDFGVEISKTEKNALNNSMTKPSKKKRHVSARDAKD
jgi:late competence protein required for DNA uptake (superfamily II DNA/RNA helicase)